MFTQRLGSAFSMHIVTIMPAKRTLKYFRFSSSLGVLPNVPQGTNRAGVVRRCYWRREKKLILVALLDEMVMSCSFEDSFVLD